VSKEWPDSGTRRVRTADRSDRGDDVPRTRPLRGEAHGRLGLGARGVDHRQDPQVALRGEARRMWPVLPVSDGGIGGAGS
jgi:hypothetical protein